MHDRQTPQCTELTSNKCVPASTSCVHKYGQYTMLWSLPTLSRNIQQRVLFCSHCGCYTGREYLLENLVFRKIMTLFCQWGQKHFWSWGNKIPELPFWWEIFGYLRAAIDGRNTKNRGKDTYSLQRVECHVWPLLYYRARNVEHSCRQVSNMRCTLVGNWIVDHSDVVGATPVGAAPTTSSFSN